MSKNIDRIAFELWCGLDSVKELEAWAVSELKKEDTHPDAYDLFRLSKDKAEKKAIQIAKETLGFSLDSEVCKIWAEEIFLKQCSVYLEGNMKPFVFCELIKKLDALFIDDLIYPNWLGGLYNECDWCDKKWTFHREYHIAEEVERIASELDKRIINKT